MIYRGGHIKTAGTEIRQAFMESFTCVKQDNDQKFHLIRT